MSEVFRTGSEDQVFGPDWDADHERPAETRTRCDDNLSPECIDDGRFQVWDAGSGLLLNLCRPCRRVWEHRQSIQDPLAKVGA